MLLEQVGQMRTLIDDLSASSEETAALIARLQVRSSTLHNAISLSADVAPLLLADFVVRYIEHVPDFIEAIHTITRDANINQQVDPLLKVAVDYFLRPPELVRGSSTLQVLLAEAYLAHRLLEEINDRFISLCGSPLVPMDTTRANIVAHELIGEPFAIELDQAVLFSADILLTEHHFTGAAFDHFFAHHRAHGWSVELSRWPCLAADRSIFVNFSGPD
tara:strand:- start:4057 stop:4713 length:657 start_codon:yes stop_codon:yes gene_type:complete